MNVPSELKFTKDHEWVRIEGDTATIGITDFAQSMRWFMKASPGYRNFRSD